MNERFNDDELTQRLKEAAVADLPRFSPALHERIMRGVQSARIEPAVRRSAYRAWRVNVPLASAGLAAVLLLCAGWMLFHITHSRPEIDRINTQAINIPSMPAVNNPVAALDETVATNWPGDRYAALDQDGQRFLHFMARELDVAPPVRR
jgi:hypothetical protein